MDGNSLIPTKPAKLTSIIMIAAAAMVYLLIVVNNLAQRTGIGLDFSRWLLAPTLILVIIAAAAALRNYRDSRWITTPWLVSLPILVVQGILVGVRVSMKTPPEIFTAYLSSILLVHGMTITASVIAFQAQRVPFAGKLAFRSRFARLTLWTLGVMFISLTSGAFVTMTGAAQACSGWLLCNGWAWPQSVNEWAHFFHRLSVGLAGGLVIWMAVVAWQRQRSQPAILVSATSSTVLFWAQALVGAALIWKNFPLDLVGLHTATAAAAWAMMIVIVVQVGLAGRTEQDEALDLAPPVSLREKVKDYLVLTKPIIVLLLLVTTFTGMVVGAGKLPPLSLVFWTLLGGALAAGGSGAINQYIDRNLDKLMMRTARRPLAAERLTPAEGLAFGVGLCLVAFYLLAVYTNLLAALLSVLGMFYYIWIYSLWLKQTTVQNIVIGGGAGAIPPLVGWAAATGEITVASLVLFVIIFFWTPPHFWALALVRVKDYARGGVPMLPVVRGEEETRKQIFIYTIVLVLITLAAPLLGIGKWIYVAGALLLGAWLTWAAWKVWKTYTPKLAWKMYRYSSMYLAFLFLVMVVDALLA